MSIKGLFFSASAAGLVAGTLLMNGAQNDDKPNPVAAASSLFVPISYEDAIRDVLNMPAMELGTNTFKLTPNVSLSSVYVNTGQKNFLQFKSYSDNFPQLEDYCARVPERCMRTYPGQPLTMTDELFKTISLYNRQVNNAIEYKDDQSVHGVEDHWGEGEWDKDGRLVGDCDDYALEKRRLLGVVLGIPYSAMAIAYVKAPSAYNEKGEVAEYGGHAVLVLRTTEGDYILDNRVEDVLLPTQTDLVFVSATNFERFTEWRSVESVNVAVPTLALK